MTVWVIHQEKPSKRNGWVPDFSSALAYGALDYVFAAEDQPSLSPKDAYALAEFRLAAFDFERDYIVWANGDPVGLGIVFLVLANKPQINKIRFLRWERRRNADGERVGGFYMPVDIATR